MFAILEGNLLFKIFGPLIYKNHNNDFVTLKHIISDIFK